MKLSLSILLLALTSSAVAADPPFCGTAASSCTSYGSRTASKCSSIISSQGISRATCRKATGTTTTTRTVRPTTTTTRTIRATTIWSTVTSTSTKWGPTVTFPPTTIVLSTRTHTIKITTTVPAETADVFRTTTTTVETSSEYAATTTTTTEYPQVPYAQETCSAPSKRDLDQGSDDEDAAQPEQFDFRSSPPRMFKFDPRAAAFPAECSCYLTVTSTMTTPLTSTTTTTRKITQISTTIIGGSVPTKTTTKTIWRSTSIPGTTRSQSTRYLTSTTKTTILYTSSEPTYTTTTSTETSTTTTTIIDSTSTVTTSIPQMADPCDPANVNNLVVSGTLSNPNVLNGMYGDAMDLTWCCYDCYWNKDCVYWVFDESQWLCSVYFTNWRKPAQSSCTTGNCPRGFPILQGGPSDGKQYGLGSCAGQVVY